MYLKEEDTPRIVEVVANDRLDFDLDIENRPADPYLKL